MTLFGRSIEPPLELARLPRDVDTADVKPASLRALADRDPAGFRRLCARLARWPIIADEDVAFVADYLRTGPMSVIDPDRGVSGELMRSFQRQLGMRREHGITFNSATNALHAAYRAIGVGPGVQVAAIGYTFHATVTPILDLGGHPILMDVDPLTGNLTYDEVRRTLDEYPEVAAIALNHNWGVPCADISRIAELAKARSLPLIEDCSHAHGASVDGVPVGEFGTISVFSLQSKKLVPGGEGGLCFTDDRDFKSSMLLVGHYFCGSQTHGRSVETSLMQTGVGGLQSRIHPLAAALALCQLQRLDWVIRNREANEGRLRMRLLDVDEISFPVWPGGTRVSHYASRARFDPEKSGGTSISNFVAALRRSGVPVERDRGGPLSTKTIYKTDIDSPVSRLDSSRPKYTDQDLPNATEHCRRALIWPVFTLDPSLVAGVIDVIAERIHLARKVG